jgi:hypothetical protein
LVRTRRSAALFIVVATCLRVLLFGGSWVVAVIVSIAAVATEGIFETFFTIDDDPHPGSIHRRRP